MPRCEFCGKFNQRGKRDRPVHNNFENHLKTSEECRDKWEEKMAKRRANRNKVWVKMDGKDVEERR